MWNIYIIKTLKIEDVLTKIILIWSLKNNAKAILSKSIMKGLKGDIIK